MLYFKRTDNSAGIDINKTSTPNQCDICQNWYFIDKGFKFQSQVCYGCHDVLMMSMKLLKILKIHGFECCCIINRISKKKAMGLLNNVNPNKKSKRL